MGSLNPESDSKQDLNDSGCVQDASVTETYKGQAQLLDLSDDVLLCILRLCSPMDLKALGHTCPRLGILVCDRTLWQRVDARDTPTGVERLQWLLTHCLTQSTQELKLSGYVNRDTRCLGIQELTWPMISEGGANNPHGDVEHFLLRMWYPHLPRYAMSPRWPDKREAAGKAYTLTDEDKAKLPLSPLSQLASQIVAGGPSTSHNTNGPSSKHPEQNAPDASTNDTQEGPASDHIDPKVARKIEMEQMAAKCAGPQFTVNEKLLKLLRNKCGNLVSLSLDYCNLDYKNTNPRYFPPKLKKLSLRGTRCYNLPLNMSFLGKIQDLLPELEYLDISECEWLEPASLMSLSKMAQLSELYMRQCVRLTECVAYASLATRYGFQKLKILDLRGSPVADSEVSAFGWLPLLEELYVSPPYDIRTNTEHTHKWDDELAPFCELDTWETEVPDYYRCKTPPPEQMEEEEEEEELKEEKKESGISEERLGDVMVGNYITCASLERRIIVIHPNRHNNESRFHHHMFVPQRDRELGHRAPRAPRANNDPAPGPSKRPHTDDVEDPAKRPHMDNVEDSVKRPQDNVEDPVKRPHMDDEEDPVKRPRLDKEINTEDNVQENKSENKTDEKTSTPGPSNPKTANAGPSDETPGPSKSDSASRDTNRPENQPNIRQCNARHRNSAVSFELYGRHLADLLAREIPNRLDGEFIQNIDPPNLPIIPGPICRRSNRSGPARPPVPLQNRAEERPDRPQHRRIFPVLRGEGHPQPVMHIDIDIHRQNYHLVTDSAVLRFGRAENENVNYVHIGPGYNPNANITGNRPDQSNLRVLSITGFNNITDRSLEHLATAAPHIRHIDFRYTSVTARGVEVFKAIRPNCEVIFGRFGEL